MDFAKELIEKLKLIEKNQTVEYPILKFYVQEMLEVAYYAGITGVKFSQNDRKTIISKIKDVKKYVETSLSHMGLVFRHNDAAYYLIVRSGLQYMNDNFKDHPECLIGSSEFDERLMSWKKDHTPLSYEDATFTKEEINKPEVKIHIVKFYKFY